MSGSAQMQRLVDAFKGLATEGNTGNYLADVENIVNSYFPKAGEEEEGGSSAAGASPAGTNISPGGGIADRSGSAPVSNIARDALAEVDVMRESPIKPRPEPPGRELSASMLSSGESLKAWGEAVEIDHAHHGASHHHNHLHHQHHAPATHNSGGAAGAAHGASPRHAQHAHAHHEPLYGGHDSNANPHLLSELPSDGDEDLLYGTRGGDHEGTGDDDFYARSVEWQRRQREMRVQHKKSQEERETEECTWAPQINAKPTGISNSGKVMYGKVEDRLHASESSRRHRLEAERRKRREEEAQNCTFKPKLNKRNMSGLSTTVHSRYMDGVIPQYPGEGRGDHAQNSSRVGGNTTANVTRDRGGDVFDRLHNEAVRREEGSRRRSRSRSRSESAAGPQDTTLAGGGRPGSTPVLYTTFNPSHPPHRQGKTQVNLNLSYEEIEATDRELADIEALLSQRLYNGTAGAFHIDTVASNYVDSDDEDYTEMDDAHAQAQGGAAGCLSRSGLSEAATERSKVDFNTFLVRQNAFEERRRANLAFLEADVAPSHHPVIRPQSKRMKSQVASGRLSAAQNQSQVTQLQQRLKTLITTSWELKNEIRKAHEKGEQLIKKLDVINNHPQCADRSATATDLKRELRSLRTTDRSTIALDQMKPLQVLPTDTLLLKVFRSERPGAIDQMLKGKLRRALDETDYDSNAQQGGAAGKGPDAETLHQYVREMLEVRSGLTEVKVRCTRVRDAMAVEISNSVETLQGCVPWETLAKMEFARGERAQVEQGEKPRAGPTATAEGDRVLARREPWQQWGKGTLVEFDESRERASVLLDGTSKAQWFPATKDCVVPEPGEAHSFAPKLREKYLETLIKTKEVVSVRVGGAAGEDIPGRIVSGSGKNWTVFVAEGPGGSGKLTKKLVVGPEAIRASRDGRGSENYGPANLDSYTLRLDEDARRREDKRRRMQAEQIMKETSDCTHAPQINAVPQYISRIAHSMQLLRGEVSS